jgi:predicted N-acyltransferase
MRTRTIDAISSIERDSWNSLLADTNPFVRHEFLSALENSGSASIQNGWLPQHIVCETDDGALIGALPLYAKDNSYGEFVFDFSWANAYHQAGLNYYPKLVSAIPFTPAAGPRLLSKGSSSDKTAINERLIAAAKTLAADQHASSLHLLFPEAEQTGMLENAGLMLRKDCQFHWRNRGYKDFDDFLAEFTSVKRKKTRRERRRIRESGIVFETRAGKDLDESLWREIMPLYEHTFLRRGREPYLNQGFFLEVSATMPENIVVFLGRQEAELAAVAICFRSDTTLYGRYWGATRFVDSLHFETCYYQGIDYCIARGLECFEPGTQGEHKISRGFVPTETWSAHWLSRPDFARAIDDYLHREREHIDHYIDMTSEHIPYRKNSD